MIYNTIDLEELIDTIKNRHDEIHKKCSTLKEWFQNIITGKVNVVGDMYGTLTVTTVCGELLRTLDVVLQNEMTIIAEDLARSYIINNEQENQSVQANIISVSYQLLRKSASFSYIIKFSRQILKSSADTHIRLRVEAAKFLYDSRMFGEDKDFWESICEHDNTNLIKILPTVLLSLFEKWPKTGLDVLFKYSTTLSEDDQLTLAGFISLFSDLIVSKTSKEEFRNKYIHCKDSVNPELKKALEETGKLMGMDLPYQIEISKNDTSPALTHYDTGNKLDSDIIDELDMLTILFNSVKSLKKNDGNSPEHFIEAFCKIVPQVGQMPFSQEKKGKIELRFVRRAVMNNIEDHIEQENFNEASILMKAIQKCIPSLHDYAIEAKKQILNLGLENKPLYLGCSEYHEDRLVMNIAVAALKKEGLMGAQVALRQWENKSFHLSTGDDAHVVARSKYVKKPSQYGLFRFNGFRVNLRVDTALELAKQKNLTATISLLKKVEEYLKKDIPLDTVLSTNERAQLALKLGLMSAKGSAFEDLRSAVEKIATGKGQQKTNKVDVSNDDAFSKFIKGQSAIYCGGAINNLLIDNWWKRSNAMNFTTILNHNEISSGFSAKKTTANNAGTHELYLENSLDFNLPATDQNKKNINSSKAAITSLLRSIGTGLQLWSAEVLNNADRLNGLARSCEAARRILKPLQTEYGIGQYAFVTKRTDPAQLIQSSDQFYHTAH